jgi:RNA polymerase sigma-70 factor, ECF subfamily
VLRGDEAETADAEQEVLIALSTALPRFRHRSSFPTYLYRLARNTAIDMIRKQRRERDRTLVAPLLPKETGGPDPAAEAERNWEKERLWAAMEKLGPEERLLLALRDAEQVSVPEIARIMGLPEGTVKSRLHRARGKLARLLGGVFHG